MTVGIYALYWEEQALVYIGESEKIEHRYKEHKRKALSNKHSNYRVQKAFLLFGIPELIILEVCSIKELPEKETFWTKEFNSIEQGLNIVEAGQNSMSGCHHANSKYSKRDILKVFSLLYKTTLTYKSIANRIKVSKNLVEEIAAGTRHLWLREEYPIKYAQLIQNKSIRTKVNQTTLKRPRVVISSDGTEYTITNINQFCRDRGLNITSSSPGISRLLAGIIKTHAGYKLKE